MIIVQYLKQLLLSIFLLIGMSVYGQDSIQVTVKANVQKDKIQLRWVVDSPSGWYYTNKHGVNIERYTLLRDGMALNAPEKVILTAEPLKPHPLDDWAKIALTDNYAAIIAQALYGDDFEISGGEKDISQIIALSQEQEQRYAMSMLAAELSYRAALFAGWAFDDTTAVRGEKYLYKIVPVNPDDKTIEDRGNAFVGLDDYQPLPRPIELDAVWGNQSVMITWNSGLLEQYYSAYYLERSEDGYKFNRTSQIPIINTTEGDVMFYTDTIANNKTYYYRLIGISSFGEESLPSDTIQGQGISKLIYNPSISFAMPDDNGKVEVAWSFDERGNNDISSFELRRGNTDKGPFTPVVKDIAPTSRSVFYETPEAENYLVIAAISKEGDETTSFPHMLIMEDSIPPAIPEGLTGYVDSVGVVHLKWNANTDKDLYGYRIFRAQTADEELVPLTDIAVKTNEYKDSININNLNRKVFYAVTALDKRYNQSEKSTVLELDKPDVIKPSAPFITKYEATEQGVLLEWVTGRDSIHTINIFRKEKAKESKDLIRTITDTKIRTYLDSSAVGGTNYAYSIVAVNKNLLESDPSLEVTVKAREATAKMKINSFVAEEADNGGVILKWQHSIPNLRSVEIYRKEGEQSFTRWKELEVWEKETLDNAVKRNTKYEYLLVIKNREGKVAQAQTKIY